MIHDDDDDDDGDDEALCCTDLTQDFQFKVHAVLSGLVDRLARVLASIFLLHAGNLQYLSA